MSIYKRDGHDRGIMKKPKVGDTIELEGKEWLVIESSHIKADEWVAFVFNPYFTPLVTPVPYAVIGYLSGYHWQNANVRYPFMDFDAAVKKYLQIRERVTQ